MPNDVSVDEIRSAISDAEKRLKKAEEINDRDAARQSKLDIHYLNIVLREKENDLMKEFPR